MRSDKGLKHHSLAPAFGEHLDKDLKNLKKLNDMIKEVHKIMNTIKANGMYSHKERLIEQDNYEIMNTPEYERKVLQMGWDFRTKQSERLCKGLEDFINKCEEELRND